MGPEAFSTSNLLPELYSDLRRLAGHYLSGQNRTLQPTALVHEAYLRISQAGPWHDRGHFLATAALAMRQVLHREHERHSAIKRQGLMVQLDVNDVEESERTFEYTRIEQAFSRLETHSAEACRVAELRLFGGLSVEEASEQLKVSPRTIKRLWSFARAVLVKELGANH
jgi:RNA polymerase sigma-70 factor, ECF subfamily